MALPFLSACGGDDEPEPKPVLCTGEEVKVGEMGACVPASPCVGDDVMLDQSGKCVPKPSLLDPECSKGFDFVVRNEAKTLPVPSNIATLNLFDFTVSLCRDIQEKGLSLVIRGYEVDRDFEEQNDYDSTGLILPDETMRFSNLDVVVNGEELAYQKDELRGSDWRASALLVSESGTSRKTSDRLNFQVTAEVNTEFWTPYKFTVELGEYMTDDSRGVYITNPQRLSLE